ncbi:hypothetical protein NM688_g4054 [Phlebia brevispora]|uniref:Uncharacterized protein n=1 Tax=Phlebia brevispora TaxID=194682 RepID=A0ACC1T4N5_9APHY|nr:hypothetical protein NM688_g4054 [Phlebia brevispora]
MSATPHTDEAAADNQASTVRPRTNRSRDWLIRQGAESSAKAPQADSKHLPSGSKRHPRVQGRPGANADAAHVQAPFPYSSSSAAESTEQKKAPRRNRAPADRPPAYESAGATDVEQGGIELGKEKHSKPPHKKPPRRKFDGKLSEPPQKPAETTGGNTSHRRRDEMPKLDDLTSTLIHSLSTRPYQDCLICFSAIHPAQPTWSCSPLLPISSASDGEDVKEKGTGNTEAPQCCWNTFHLKCVRTWATKSVKDIEEAWRARGESRKGEWRCPGCQAKRKTIPTSYWCFCGSTPDPKPPRLATPHSCGGPCFRCGEGVPKISCIVESDGERKWTGLFQCEKLCDRVFQCGIHHCEKRCHPPSSKPALCPRSPSLVTHCPCGKHTLEPSSAPYFPKDAVLIRTSCSDPIPRCNSTCLKPLEGCSHFCAMKCHIGVCPLCTVPVVRPCRCGMTTRNVPCHEDQARARGDLGEILCDKACTALRACGRHQCNRLCCPLASLAHLGKGKGKKKASAAEVGALADQSGWHECDLLCGKLLTCGNHTCEEKDHRGACPSCLRSSFEEMVCNCGRTILEPPIPCGTRIHCTFPCARTPPPCGHPRAQHACHEDPIPCPPCPYLTTKLCACGKKMVGNVRCSQERVSCGTTCESLPAHHPCALPCHAPAACSEAEPCRTPITLTCPCGRIRQQVPCGRSTLNPGGLEGSQPLKCTNECLMAKRNARLAEALGINPEARSTEVTYSDELLSSAKGDVKFCLLVEKTFAEFITSDKKTQVLPQMPPYRRKFVRDVSL